MSIKRKRRKTMIAPKIQKVVIILSITSDIGLALAKRYARDGYGVIGTYRSRKLLKKLKGIHNIHLYPCDLADPDSISSFVKEYAKLGLKWDVFVSCPCDPLPARAFFDCNFEEWSNSVHINVIEQLRVLHQLHPFRNNASKAVDVVFFAGGGVNNAVVNFSAYTASKIMLIKMCEFLDAENKDLNIFIVGPGWTRTKTHELVLANVDQSDERRQKIREFLKGDKGTSMDDIYNCIKWLCHEGKRVASGRNFSVVNDPWKGAKKEVLAKELRSDVDLYKLRRCRNDFLVNKGGKIGS